MTLKCSICFHPQRNEIDKGIVRGETVRNIAKRYRVSPAAVQRHKKHIKIAIPEPEPVTPPARIDIARELQNCIEEAKSVLDNAKKMRNPHLALTSIQVLGRLLDTAGKLTLTLAEQKPKIEIVLVDGSQSENF